LGPAAVLAKRAKAKFWTPCKNRFYGIKAPEEAGVGGFDGLKSESGAG